jgi:hypothetical protein
MNKAELAELNKIYNDNIHIVGPGYKWLVEWDTTEPKPKPTSAEIVEQLEIALDEIKVNGFTEGCCTTMIKAFSYVQETDKPLYYELVNMMKESPRGEYAG